MAIAMTAAPQLTWTVEPASVWLGSSVALGVTVSVTVTPPVTSSVVDCGSIEVVVAVVSGGDVKVRLSQTSLKLSQKLAKVRATVVL